MQSRRGGRARRAVGNHENTRFAASCLAGLRQNSAIGQGIGIQDKLPQGALLAVVGVRHDIGAKAKVNAADSRAAHRYRGHTLGLDAAQTTAARCHRERGSLIAGIGSGSGLHVGQHGSLVYRNVQRLLPGSGWYKYQPGA